jgi:hypothetical protein
MLESRRFMAGRGTKPTCAAWRSATSEVIEGNSGTVADCSFRGKSEDDLRKLVARPHQVFICDECVELSMVLVREGGGSLYLRSPDFRRKDGSMFWATVFALRLLRRVPLHCHFRP